MHRQTQAQGSKKTPPRRRWLATISLMVLLVPGAAQSSKPTWRDATLSFVKQHARPSGWYGLPDVPWSDPRLTEWALAIQRACGAARPDSSDLRRGLADQVDQAKSAAQRVAIARLCERFGWPLPKTLSPAGPWAVPPMTWHGSPPLNELADRVLLARSLGKPPHRGSVRAWLGLWRAPDGGWHHPLQHSEIKRRILAGDFVFLAAPPRSTAPSNLSSTLAALRVLTPGLAKADRKRAIESVQSRLVQSPGQQWGFRERVGAAEPSLHATWQALQCLELLEAERPKRILEFVLSHRAENGGFRAHPAAAPSLEATFMAIQCLASLGIDGLPGGDRPASESRNEAPENHPLWQAIVQIGPAPASSLVLAHRAGAHLILLKGDAESKLVQRAKRLQADLGLEALQIAASREEHLVSFGAPGAGYVTHCSEWIFDPERNLEGSRGQHADFDALIPGLEAGRKNGALAFATVYRPRALLEPAFHRRDAYDALTMAWAMANDGDVPRTHPWIHQLIGAQAPIGNHDAHGDPFHWLHRGLRARTLFFAPGPSLGEFRQAIRSRRTVAVAHGDQTVLYGKAPWRSRAAALQHDWDQGRAPHHPKPWLPAPLAIPIAEDTWQELGFRPGGRAVLVRAARGLGDDAFPFEVELKIAGHPIPLRAAPPLAREVPYLWAVLPPGPWDAGEPVEVMTRAFGSSSKQQLRFRPAGALPATPFVPPLPLPAQLEFDARAEAAFVRTSLAPDDFDGSLGLVTSRADFFLARNQQRELELRWSGGAGLEPVEVFIDGLAVGRFSPSAMPRTVRFALPQTQGGSTAHTISLRTPMPGWLPSFPRPLGDLRLEAIGFR